MTFVTLDMRLSITSSFADEAEEEDTKVAVMGSNDFVFAGSVRASFSCCVEKVAVSVSDLRVFTLASKFMMAVSVCFVLTLLLQGGKAPAGQVLVDAVGVLVEVGG